MADIVIRGIEVSESLDIMIMGNKVAYSTNKWNDMEEATDFIILPEGYGRLIDADKLMEIYTADSYDLNKMHMTSEAYEKLPTTIGRVRSAISNAPTILEAEEKKDGK